MKVATANIRSVPVMPESSVRADVARVAARADVIGWQEIAERPAYYRAALEDLLGFETWWPGAGTGEHSSANQIPISWRSGWFVRVGQGRLRTHAGQAGVTPARWISWVVLQDLAGVRSAHVNTHFVHQAWTSHPERRVWWNTHLRLLRAKLVELGDAHQVVTVGGDFNRGDWFGLRPLMTYAPSAPTFAGRRYDYLAHLGGRMGRAATISLKSDHHGLVAETTTGVAMAWRPARSILTIRSQVDLRWPTRSRASDGMLGDAAHASRSSDHNPWVKDSAGVGVVTAIDITNPPAGGQALVDALVASRDRRIKYVIHNHRIWRSYAKPGIPAWAPAPYTGPSPHTKHVHLSVQPTHQLYDSPEPWRITNQQEDDDMTPAQAKELIELVRAQNKTLAQISSQIKGTNGNLNDIERILKQDAAG